MLMTCTRSHAKIYRQSRHRTPGLPDPGQAAMLFCILAEGIVLV